MQTSQCQHSRSRVYHSGYSTELNKPYLSSSRSVTSLKQYHPSANTEASHLRRIRVMNMTPSVLRSGITSTSGRTGHESAHSFGSFCASCPPLRVPSANTWAGPAHATCLQNTPRPAQMSGRWRDGGKPTSQQMIPPAHAV